MPHLLFWVVFLAYCSFFNKCETKQQQGDIGKSYILSKLFRNKPPIVLYIAPKREDESLELYSKNLRQDDRSEGSVEELRVLDRPIEKEPIIIKDEDEIEEDSVELRNDERAYVLYHLLRTTIEEEDLDPKVIEDLQPAKEFLRAAFTGRCNKLNQCKKKCPSKPKKYHCTVHCKQIFDDLDECDPKPKKCNPSTCDCGSYKCGKTMPPSWLL